MAPNRVSISDEIEQTDWSDEVESHEAKDFNFMELRPKGEINVFEACQLYIKATVVVGVLNMGEAFKGCGLLTATFVTIFVSFLNTVVSWDLITAAHKVYKILQVPSLNYPELVEASINNCTYKKLRKYAFVFRYLMDASMAALVFVSTSYFMTYVAIRLSEIFHTYEVPVFSDLHQKEFVFFLIIPYILLSWIFSLKVCAYLSVFGNTIIVLIIILLINFASKAVERNTHNIMPPLAHFRSFGDTSKFMPVVVSSMFSSILALPIENKLKTPQKAKLVVIICNNVIMAIHVIVGSVAYWGWRDDTADSIIHNFPQDGENIVVNIFVRMSDVVLMTNVIISFMYTFRVGFDILWVYARDKFREETHWIYQRIWSSIFIVFTGLISVMFPETLSVMNFSVCVYVSTTGYMLPALVDLVVRWDEVGQGRFKWRIWKFVLMQIFGIYLAIFAAINGFSKFVNMNETEHVHVPISPKFWPEFMKVEWDRLQSTTHEH